MQKAYPLLGEQLNPSTSNQRRKEVVQSMRKLISANKAPDKKLADTFAAIVSATFSDGFLSASFFSAASFSSCILFSSCRS